MKTHYTYSSTFAILLVALLFSPVSFSQTGPGGVGNSTNNKYWLDAHALDLTDGSPVTIWDDLSGNGTNFSQFAGSRKPTYVTSGIGGLPAVSYDGTNDLLVAGANPSMESPGVTYFLVYDRIGTATSMIINADYASSFRKWRSYSNNGQNRMLSVHFSPGIRFAFYEDPGPGAFFSTEMSSTGTSTYLQGTLLGSSPQPYTAPTGHNGIYLGSRSSTPVPTYNYNGLISEVIIYNGTLNPLQRIFVENYLGAKYGLAIPTDRYDYEATHKFGLIGIGNDGTNSQTTAQGAGVLELSSPSDLGASEFLVTAHTDFDLNEYNFDDIPAALIEHQRFERTWRVDEAGEVGNVTLTFFLGAENDYAVPETYRLLVDSDGTFSDATIIAGTYTEASNSVSFTTNLADGDHFTLTGVLEVLEIHSITDGAWSEITTWDCACIPSINDLVFIDPGTEVDVDVDGFMNYLKVEITGTLVMNEDVTLDINGDFEISGTTDFNDGTIAITGDVPQDIRIITSGVLDAELFNVYIDNTSAGDVTFTGSSGTFSLNGTLSPERGSIVIDPSCTFRVRSTSETEGGRVGPIIPPTTITGDVRVERNIPAGSANWRNLSSAVIGSTFEQWDPDLAMSGPGFPDGCAFGPDGCFESVTFTQNGIFAAAPNVSFAIANGRGFEIFVGTDLETFAGTTLNSTGPLNTSADIVKSYGTGWSTVGNPYASPIAFSTVTRSPTIGNYYYVLNGETGAYEWYDGASGTSSIPSITEDGLIAIGQGVWIYANSAGTITYNQFNKSEEQATFLRTSHAPDMGLDVILSENASTYRCKIQLQETPEALDGLDSIGDIRHLSTGLEMAPSLAMNLDGAQIRKNFIAENGNDKSFELHTSFLNEGEYTFAIGNWENFRAYAKILIIDKLTGAVIDLKDEDYVFYAAKTNPEAKATSRFTLVLTNSEEAVQDNAILIENDSDTFGDLTVKQIGYAVDVQSTQTYEQETTVTLTNALGQTQAFTTTTQIIEGSNMINLPERLEGFYIITLQTGEEIITKKIVL